VTKHAIYAVRTCSSLSWWNGLSGALWPGQSR